MKETGNGKKDNGEIDEQYLMSMMAGGVRKEGLEQKAKTENDTPLQEPVTKGKKHKGRNGEADYDALFLKNVSGSARNGKSVYIRPEFHERLTRIVQVIGEDKISLYAYLDNILEHHFSEFGDQIRKSFDDKYKPIL